MEELTRLIWRPFSRHYILKSCVDECNSSYLISGAVQCPTTFIRFCFCWWTLGFYNFPSYEECSRVWSGACFPTHSRVAVTGVCSCWGLGASSHCARLSPGGSSDSPTSSPVLSIIRLGNVGQSEDCETRTGFPWMRLHSVLLRELEDNGSTLCRVQWPSSFHEPIYSHSQMEITELTWHIAMRTRHEDL